MSKRKNTLDKRELKHFKFINNSDSKIDPFSPSGGCQGCDAYEDAPVCTDGSRDIECGGERYRGCYPGQYDCADNPGNDDDVCCWGHGPGSGDNIDHAYCSHNDADWGGLCVFGWDHLPV